ncbi:MAG: Hsp70 family protein [Solobacterium sp.]|nr:Hsp70 family protein [Solobacterium sp.]
MDKFYGFDLGDAESAVAVYDKNNPGIPEVLTICDARSIITAYALLRNGDVLIGESACYDPDAVERKISFKSRFLVDPAASRDIKGFAAGVLGELYLAGNLIKGEDTCFYIGCPAGWNKGAREDYRSIFEKNGYPPSRVISESRAALVSACQSKHLQVGYDILNRPVLVVDIGSSTTDFAYIMGGREVELQTGGEVFLGGGIMDEILLEESIKNSPDAKKIRKVFAETDAWKSYCEFAARKLKEQYFSDPEYWKKNDCMRNIVLKPGILGTKITLRVNEKTADAMLNQKVERLGNKSFKEVFIESLRQAKGAISEKEPELLFLTGGVSKLAQISEWCREIFPDAIVITGAEPEFSVARGLAYCGKIDDELREFKEEVERLVTSSTVEKLVAGHTDELYQAALDRLIEPILRNVALPAIQRWRNGEIARLGDMDNVLKEDIDAYLHTDEARSLIAKAVSSWLKNISFELEEHTMPICVKHNVPYSALNLTTYLSLSDIDFGVSTKNLFAVEEITWLIDTIVSIIVGLLCGGGGVAMIANGAPGIIAGAIVSLAVLALGKEQMQKGILKLNLPKPIRKAFPMRLFESRFERIGDQIKESVFANLEKDKDEEITGRLVREISDQIENCLIKMAEVVEIPIG